MSPSLSDIECIIPAQCTGVDHPAALVHDSRLGVVARVRESTGRGRRRRREGGKIKREKGKNNNFYFCS